MSYSTMTHAFICYIENHVHDGKLDMKEFSTRFGFSENYIREMFAKQLGMPVMSYYRRHRIMVSAAQLLHTEKNIIDIAYDYGFSSHEAYTRAFSRVIGMTPSDFRVKRPIVAKAELERGVYGLELQESRERRRDLMKKNIKMQDSTILYGISKVGFGAYGSQTPYPICIKAVSEFLGDDISYPYIMAATGAAFRLVWNTKDWDLSNVDYFHTFKESNDVYEWAGKVLGRKFDSLGRDEKTSKEEFTEFIKEHLAEGYPCIALGIIGPPEPCIIAGYKDNGTCLLGWNFFQDDAEFAKDIEKEENGYFSSNLWWENTDTQAVMCIGPVIGEMMSEREVIKNAIAALEGRTDMGYAKGILAYDAWESMLLDNQYFPENLVFDDLFSKLLVQNDAMRCIQDGRGHAAMYLREIAEGHSEEEKKNLLEIADCFDAVKEYAEKMIERIGDWSDTDRMLKNLADRGVREEVGKLIQQAKKEDEKALQGLKELYAGI